MAEVLEAENQDAFDVLKAIPMFKGWGRSRSTASFDWRKSWHPPGVDIMKQETRPTTCISSARGEYESGRTSSSKRSTRGRPARTPGNASRGPCTSPSFSSKSAAADFLGRRRSSRTCRAATHIRDGRRPFLVGQDRLHESLNMGHKSHAVDTVKHKAAYGYPDDNDILSSGRRRWR